MGQTIPTPDPLTGLVECNWINPCTITTSSPTDPTEWPSATLLVKLTGSSGKQSYIVFAIRDDSRASAILFLCATNTYQAYNNWGGKSLYEFNSIGPRASKVSYNRPYAINPYGTQLDGAGDFLRRWEYNMVRFLEHEGYDVAYTTDVDADMSAQSLLPHNGLLIVGHNEYWSWGMRQNIIAARDAGVGLGFFSANNCFWQIRYEQSSVTGDANRTIACYKDAATDPYALDTDLSNDHLVTVNWRAAPVNLPEGAFIGIQYGAEPGDGGDIVIENAASWVCSNTGLQNGDHLPGLLGYEDPRGDRQPAGRDPADCAFSGAQCLIHGGHDCLHGRQWGDRLRYGIHELQLGLGPLQCSHPASELRERCREANGSERVGGDGRYVRPRRHPSHREEPGGGRSAGLGARSHLDPVFRVLEHGAGNSPIG